MKVGAEVQAPALSGAWKPHQIYLLTLLVLVSVSSYMDRSIMALLQEVIKHDLALSDWEIGLISGPAFALFHSLVGVPVARIAERADRPKLLSAAVVVWSGATALCGLATNFAMLGLCRMGVGMGEGGCNPISHALVADNFSAKQRGAALAVLSSGTSIGGILAPIIGGFVALYWGWRAAFVAIGLPGLIIALLCWLTLREFRTAKADGQPLKSFFNDIKWLFSNRAFAYIFAAAAFNGIAIQGTGIFTVSFLMRLHGVNVAEAGGILSLRGAMGLAATFVGGYLADRFADDHGRSYVLVPSIGAALSFVLFLVAFTATVWPLVIGALLAAVFATELKAGPNFAAVQNVVPSTMRATAAAVFFLAATVIGAGFGAALVGGMSDFAAATMFPSTLGAYTVHCHGGGSAAFAGACAAASREGLRYALIGISFAFLGAMACFYMASRTITINAD
jgi:MFS transporter, Spinster family, sphingosine-1-phosphate transporter